MTKKICIFLVAALGFVVVLFVCCAAPSDNAAPHRPHYTSLPSVPSSASFCGEAIPLDRSDVYESLDREIMTNTFWHNNTLLVIKRMARLFPVIEPILKEYGVPDDMKYLCVMESTLSPTAKSPAEAVGLWQFLEATAKDYGLVVNDEIDERCDVEKSTRAACRMLLANYRSLKSWTLVAAAYNGGLTRVRRCLKQQKQQSYYDIHWAEETGRYVYRIVAFKTILSDADSYGFDISDDDGYKPIAYEEIRVAQPISDLPTWAVEHGTSYKMLRILNPWIKKMHLMNAKADTLSIRIPRH